MIPLRADLNASGLCHLAPMSMNVFLARRILALAVIYGGRNHAQCRGTCTKRRPVGAVCPQEGKGTALMLLSYNTTVANLHGAEMSNVVSPDTHAGPLRDRAE